MLKRNLMIAVSGAALMAAASSSPAFAEYDVEAIQDQTISEQQTYPATTFNEYLAEEYKEFATFEAYEMYDWVDAEYFAEKAIAADNGEFVGPEYVSNWDIPPEHEAELRSAWDELILAFAHGAKQTAPSEAATAQAKYDCWMEQQEEDHQPVHIAACKHEFVAALSDLKSAMQPKVAATVTTTETVDVPATQHGAVFFEFDEASITPTAKAALDSLAASLMDKKEIELHVVGHADTSGPSDYNRQLSRERAQAVVDALRARGMLVADLKDIDVEAKGESDPIVKTGDGVREQANRRVEIYSYAQDPVTVSVTKQTAAVLQ